MFRSAARARLAEAGAAAPSLEEYDGRASVSGTAFAAVAGLPRPTPSACIRPDADSGSLLAPPPQAARTSAAAPSVDAKMILMSPVLRMSPTCHRSIGLRSQTPGKLV